MRNYVVEKSWQYKDYPCVVLMLRNDDLSLRHRCGYVAVPTGHIIHGLNCSDSIPNVLSSMIEKVKLGKTGKRGIIPIFLSPCCEKMRVDVLFDVHGSITFSQAHDSLDPYPIQLERADSWWLGFDAAHSGDSLEKQTLEYMVQECENLVEQLIEADKLAKE